MPMALIPVRIVRQTRTPTATGGKSVAETDIPGSPFTCRVFRVTAKTINRDEAAAGTATDDVLRRLAIYDGAAPVRKNDVALVPSDDSPGTTERAKILLVRRFGDRVQCDLETGVQG